MADASQHTIESLMLSIRAHNCLTHAGIDTLEELLTYTPNDLSRLPWLGRVTLNEIVDCLSRLGFALRQDDQHSPQLSQSTCSSENFIPIRSHWRLGQSGDTKLEDPDMGAKLPVSLSDNLKLLAKGINPETGEMLDKSSVANTPEAIRILFCLADEIMQEAEPIRKEKKKDTKDLRTRNIEAGRPPRSHYPWKDEELTRLKTQFDGIDNIEQLANVLERSTIAVAVQLHKLLLISDEELENLKGEKGYIF
jgi:hypothetical protein